MTDPRVSRLAEDAEVDDLMAELQAELRAGNTAIASDLARLFRDTGKEVGVRSFALETLSAARLPAFAWLTKKLVMVMVAMGSGRAGDALRWNRGGRRPTASNAGAGRAHHRQIRH